MISFAKSLIVGFLAVIYAFLKYNVEGDWYLLPFILLFVVAGIGDK